MFLLLKILFNIQEVLLKIETRQIIYFNVKYQQDKII